MRITKLLLQLSCYGALLAGIPGVAAPLCAQSAPVSELPDSPGATVAKSQSAAQLEKSSKLSIPHASMQLASLEEQGNSSQQEPEQSRPQTPPAPQPPGQMPVGTAAAGVIPADGIAASQPAGVAIAPAKQRRVRTIVLRMGAIVGTGIAVGSVVALTQGTSSKPPGAH